MTIPQSLPAFQESCDYLRKGIKATALTSIEGVKKVALPIITFLGESGSFGVNGLKHVFHAGVGLISNFISLINNLIKRLFFSKEVKIAPVKPKPLTTESEAPLLKKTEDTLSDYKDYYFEPPMLTEMQREQIFTEMTSSILSLLQKINIFIATKTPSEAEKEEFLANLRIELTFLSDKIDFAIDPVTQNIEELIAPKEMVFTQVELILRSLFKKMGELIIQYSPTTEEQAQIIATLKTQFDTILEQLIANALTSDWADATKALDSIESRNIY